MCWYHSQTPGYKCVYSMFGVFLQCLVVNGMSQSTDRVKNSLQFGLFIIMVDAVLTTNCKDTSNHLIVCWTNLVMHTAKL